MKPNCLEKEREGNSCISIVIVPVILFVSMTCSSFSGAGGGGDSKLSSSSGSVAALMRSSNAEGAQSQLPEVKKGRLRKARKADVTSESQDELLIMTPVGDPDRFAEYFKTISSAGVKPLAEYVMKEAYESVAIKAESTQSCQYGVCRVNAKPRDCVKRIIFGPFAREGYFRRLNAFPDTIWIFNPDVAKVILPHFGKTMLKEDSVYAFQIVMGKHALFSSDHSDAHLKKRKDFKHTVGGQIAVNSSDGSLLEVAERSILDWSEKVDRTTEDIREVANKYLTPLLVRTVFGVNLYDYPDRLKDIIEHFSGIIPDIVTMNNDPLFYLRYRFSFFLESYVKSNYSIFYEKRDNIIKDVGWIINLANDLPIERQGRFFKNIVEKANIEGRGHLKDDEVCDLINPLLAGGDTGSGLVTITLTELARSPDLQKMIHDEYIGIHKEASGTLTSEDISKSNMPVLFEFVNEVLLKYAPAPVTARRMAKDLDVELFDENLEKRVIISFKKNDMVSIPLGLLGYYPVNPNPFVSKDCKNAPYQERVQSMFAFANGSPHQCVGEHLGKQLMASLIVKIFEHGYKVGLTQKFEEYDIAWMGTVRVRTKIPLKLYSDIAFEDLPTFEDGSVSYTAEVEEGMATMSISAPSKSQYTDSAEGLRKRPVGSLHREKLFTETSKEHQTPPAENVPPPETPAQ